MIIRVSPTKGIETDKVRDALYREALNIGLKTLYEQKKLEEAEVTLKPIKSKPRHY